MTEFLYGDITEKILGAAFEVWKVLGYGLLEKVYENALVEELEKMGVKVQQQFADLFVEEKVVVEIKAEKSYNPQHEAQLLNYLKATGIKVGLLLNFGEKKCDFKRLAM